MRLNSVNVWRVIRRAAEGQRRRMATDREQWADSLSADTSGGWLAGFFADEDEFDRRSLWRFGSWGVGAVAAVTVAVLANQHGMNLRRDQFAAADVVRQS